MRCNRIQQDQKGFELFSRYFSGFVDLVDQGHHGCDRCVVFQGLIVAGYFLDGLVHFGLQLFGVGISVYQAVLQFPYTLEETTASFYAFLRPGCT